MTDLLVDEDNIKSDSVQVKSVNYKDMIKQTQSNSDNENQIRLHHFMVIKPPPYIYERDVPNPEDEDETENVNEDKEVPKDQCKDKPVEDKCRTLDERKLCLTCQCASKLCPPRGQVAKVLTLSLILVTLWAVCYCVLGEVAMPGHHHIYVTIEGGTLFSLLVMFTVSSVAGWLVQWIHLPP